MSRAYIMAGSAGMDSGTGFDEAGDTATLLTLTPDRSLLPARVERFSHDALAVEAAGLERLGCWDSAAAYWEAAAREAPGENLAWCQARMAWCLRRARETLSAAEQMMPLARSGETSWS